MSYESICKKMNYDPLVDSFPAPIAECDDRQTPFAVLTIEEIEFLEKCIAEKIAKAS